MDSYFDSPSGEVDDHFITDHPPPPPPGRLLRHAGLGRYIIEGSSYESGNFGSTKVGVGFGI